MTGRKLMKRTIGMLALGGVIAAGAGHARAQIIGVVPNAFNCDSFGRCRQVNGAYSKNVPTWCKHSYQLVSNPNRSISLCNKWVARF